MSRVNALLASFKSGQKKALQLQSDARHEREDKLAKASAGGGGGVASGQRHRQGSSGTLMWATASCRCRALCVHPPCLELTQIFHFAGRGRGGRGGAGRGRGGKATSAASGYASASVASAAGMVDWRQRSRTGQQAVPMGFKLKAVVDFLRAAGEAGEPQKPQAVAAATGL